MQERLLGGGFVVGTGCEEAKPFSFSLLDLDDLSLREQLEPRDI